MRVHYRQYISNGAVIAFSKWTAADVDGDPRWRKVSWFAYARYRLFMKKIPSYSAVRVSADGSVEKLWD